MPASIAFTFGSVGDIISLIQLSGQIIYLLVSTSGSSESYQALVLDVTRLQNFLEQLVLAIRNENMVSCRARAIFSERYAEDAVVSCRALLERIRQRTMYYRNIVARRASGTWMDTWRKAGWMLFRQGEIEAFREQICEHNQLIVQALAALNYDALQVVKRTVDQANVRIEETSITTSVIECDVKVILRLLHGIDDRLPPALGYPWKGGRQSAIQFEDAIGRKYPLPLEFCTNIQTLHQLMSFILDQEGPRLLAKLPRLYELPRDAWSRAVYTISYKTGETTMVDPSSNSSWPKGGLMHGDTLKMSAPVVIRVLGCTAVRYWNYYTGLHLIDMLNEPFDWASPQSRKLRFMTTGNDPEILSNCIKYHADGV